MDTFPKTYSAVALHFLVRIMNKHLSTNEKDIDNLDYFRFGFTIRPKCRCGEPMRNFSRSHLAEPLTTQLTTDLSGPYSWLEQGPYVAHGNLEINTSAASFCSGMPWCIQPKFEISQPFQVNHPVCCPLSFRGKSLSTHVCFVTIPRLPFTL